MLTASGDSTVGIVIISRNEGAELAATVANLLETAPPGSEIVVVDDASTDGSTDFLEDRPEIDLVHSEGVGVARARNLGAARVRSDVIVFADAHVRAPAGWHRPLLDALSRDDVGAVAPGVYSLSDPKCRGFGLALTGPDLHARWLHRHGDYAREVPILPGCFLMIKRPVFEAVGGYDPAMRQLGGNDNELSCRLWLLGHRLLNVSEIEVGHLFRAEAPYAARWVSVVHNRLRMALVHFDSERLKRVIGALRGYEAFPQAMAMAIAPDIFTRRCQFAGLRMHTDEWYCEKFSLPC